MTAGKGSYHNDTAVYLFSFLVSSRAMHLLRMQYLDVQLHYMALLFYVFLQALIDILGGCSSEESVSGSFSTSCK